MNALQLAEEKEFDIGKVEKSLDGSYAVAGDHHHHHHHPLL
jgi:hypothetical protein